MSPTTSTPTTSTLLQVADVLALPRVQPPLPWLANWQEQARAQAAQLAWPTRRDEDWRSTPLKPLLEGVWRSPTPVSLPNLPPEFALPEAKGQRLVMVNGFFAPELSDRSQLPAGVQVQALSELAADPGLDLPAESLDVLGALNGACLQDGVVVRLGRQQILSQPLHLLFLTTGDAPTFGQTRCWVIAEAGSEATLVEEHRSLKAGHPYVTNSVVTVQLAPQARIKHLSVQTAAPEAVHLAQTAIAQATDSHYTHYALSGGAQLSRHTLQAQQTGPNSETVLYGLTLATDQQLSDLHSTIDHSQPHGTSEQLHKCIVSDHARAVFNGRVVVRQYAQGTDSRQSNRNLLLSDQARVDTKPQLEIYADDVKCAHGATVSQLEETEVFYLRSRGLTLTQAQRMLTYGFAAEILDLLPVPSVAQRFEAKAQAIFKAQAELPANETA